MHTTKWGMFLWIYRLRATASLDLSLVHARATSGVTGDLQIAPEVVSIVFLIISGFYAIFF